MTNQTKNPDTPALELQSLKYPPSPIPQVVCFRPEAMKLWENTIPITLEAHVGRQFTSKSHAIVVSVF